MTQLYRIDLDKKLFGYWQVMGKMFTSTLELLMMFVKGKSKFLVK